MLAETARQKARTQREIDTAMRTYTGPVTKITPEMIHANVRRNMAENIKRSRSMTVSPQQKAINDEDRRQTAGTPLPRKPVAR